MTRTIRTLGILVTAAALLTACTVKKQDAPELSGPSVLGTSLTLSVNPDTLRLDGSSQTTMAILALDANSQPIKNLPVRVDIYGYTYDSATKSAVGGIADYGQLNAKNVVTNADGRASVIYTAPDQSYQYSTVQLWATPATTDAANSLRRSVLINLVQPGVILPPNGTPTASFIYSPSAPITFSDITFDASASTDSDGTVVGWAWNFGDGSTGQGKVVTHQFTQAGAYTVTLTVTDDGGYSASKTGTVTVVNAAAPTAEFAFSPSNPAPHDTVYFNASASKAAVGRTIVRYDWDFGTGRTGTGITASKVYDTEAKYKVTLTVTDDVGNTAVKTVEIEVKTP